MNLFSFSADTLLTGDFSIFLADVGAGGGSEEAGYMPIDAASAIPVIFWSVLLFATLFFVLDRAILPRIQRTIERRTLSVDDDNQKARQTTDQLVELRKSTDKVTAESKSKAKAILAEARDVSSKIQSEELSGVDEEITAKIAEAESRVADARDQAMAKLPSMAEQTVSEILSKMGVNATKRQISEAVASVVEEKASQ